MPNLSEIKKRILGVHSTHQVTNAMYLISASKSKRAKAQLESVRPFFNEVENSLADIMSAHAVQIGSEFTEYVDRARSQKADRKCLCFAIGGDKGMAGGYNHNLVKFLSENVDRRSTTLCVAGALGRNRAISEGFNVDREFLFPVMNPNLMRARDISDILIEKYRSGEYAEVFIVYTRMITALKLVPVLLPLLPLTKEHFANVGRESDDNAIGGSVGGEVVGGTGLDVDAAGAGNKYLSFHFEPGPAEVFASLTPQYVKGVVYAALVDAYTSEQNARMIAMENATKNADEIVTKLTLQYNHARQAIITQGITEIVSGIPD